MEWEAPAGAQQPRRVLLAKPLPAEMSEATLNKLAPSDFFELESVLDGTWTFAHSEEMVVLASYNIHFMLQAKVMFNMNISQS